MSSPENILSCFGLSFQAMTWPKFTNVHPFAPKEQAQGYYELFKELATDLAEITGMDGASLQPNRYAKFEILLSVFCVIYFPDPGLNSAQFVLDTGVRCRAAVACSTGHLQFLISVTTFSDFMADMSVMNWNYGSSSFHPLHLHIVLNTIVCNVPSKFSSLC